MITLKYMLSLSYNLSPKLKEKLQTINNLRQDILLIPLSSKDELIIQWNAILDRTYCSLSLAGNSLNKSQMTKLLTSQIFIESSKTKMDKNEKDVIGYKKALNYISQNWLVSKKYVTVKDILMLYDIFHNGDIHVPLSRIQELLDYLQAQEENPIIQSGIANLGIIRIHPFNDGNGRLARLLSLLFLYKQGFDVRKLIVPEKAWIKDRQAFKDAAQNFQETSSITLWLEYYADSIITQLQETLSNLRSGSHDSLGISTAYWELNDRQKLILSILEEPRTTITNRKVQEQFKISQITASRDLSKLTNLDLIFTHGKGRSVYYTKV